ncbi:MAG: endonuclease/exonuclease/phosphatase family protein [Myxococcales bacterium]|nr:endonuclease/exonuclease/phosphatase family protein [Myxococcales bacterium]
MRVATWNVLADDYIRPQYYPTVAPQHLDPQQRWSAVVAQILAVDADVLCLQELEAHRAVQLRTELAGAYAVNYAQKGLGKLDGCAILSRSDPLQHRRVEFSDGSGHVGLLCQLQTGLGVLWVASTHLRWGQHNAPIGRGQALELLAQLPNGPAIVCGDFNATIDSQVVQPLLAAGFVDAHCESVGHSCNSNRNPKRIDFIFTHLLVATGDELPQLAPDLALPNATQASDHLVVTARIRAQ